VPAVSAGEAAELETFAASTPAPGTPAVTELFRRQVVARPDAPAVLDQGRLWTYRELDDLAERLAATVRARRLPPAAAVAVRLPRSATQIAAMLAVMRSGHVYLPVDPANPADRLARILRDAECPLLLTDAARPDLPAWPAELVEVVDVGTAGSRMAVDRPGDLDREPIDPRRPAYLIYTSGSTGRPKGVEVDHAALSSVIQCYVRQYDLTPADRLSQTMNHSFDAGLLDTLPALVCGASIAVLPDEARLEPTALWDRLAEAGVTLSFITTALFTAALDNAPTTARGLRMLQFGGELCTAVPEGLPFPLEHMYGPTEASIWASAGPLDPAGPVHIGRPVGGLSARVLDAWLRPVPAGVAGELYLAGERLAIGYRGAAGATASRFVPDPWSARGGRMYRTGDRVRWNRDGRLEFLGRTDAQVKLRGFRIELGEIEAVLAGHPAVAEVTVVVRTAATGPRQLCAYLRLHPGGTVAAVRAHAEQQLPGWMLPASFTVLTSFPLNANGKTDHGALPPPDPAPVRAFEAPVGAVEELMAAVWCAVLGVARVGRTDDFFAVGGHSLLATTLLSRVADATGCRLPVRLLFDRPVLKDLAFELEEAIVAAALDGPPAPTEAHTGAKGA
jgi:amino acid adenylation domain-containing protein